MFDRIRFEVEVLEFRFNRADPDGMRRSLESVRAELRRVESEILPPVDQIAREREAEAR